MSAIDSPAFPRQAADPVWGDGTESFEGIYAAIKLRVPMSGDAELDAMILESRRLDYAVQVLAGLCANPSIHQPNGMSGWSLVNCHTDDLARYALHLADAMLAARKGGSND